MPSTAALLLAVTLLGQTPLPTISVRAPGAELSLEVAGTEAQREYGLMNRTFLLRHHGMLFVFAQDEPVSFWMKNTLIALDMVFVSSNGRVESVAARVPASTLRTPDSNVARRSGFAKYVLELPAGEAAADGLSAGTLIPELHR